VPLPTSSVPPPFYRTYFVKRTTIALDDTIRNLGMSLDRLSLVAPPRRSKPWRIEVYAVKTPLIALQRLADVGRAAAAGWHRLSTSAIQHPAAHMRRASGRASMPDTKTDEQGRRFAAFNCQLQGPCPPPGRFPLPERFAGAILALKPPDIW
jgi:hypothetical protein